MANLEPIEDGDLDLKNKFLGSAEKENEQGGRSELEKESAVVPAVEKPEKKESVAVEKEKAYSRILSKIKNPQSASAGDDTAIPQDAKSISEEESAEAKIDKLVKLATNKGVVHAVKVARHLEDNYALDEFHDRLVADDLRTALISQGMLKEI